MSSVLEEMLSNYTGDDEEALQHYGMPRRSGRYPWGSGDDAYQRTGDLLSRIELLKKDGWTETPENIMKEFGLTTTQYRIENSLAKAERRSLDVARVKSLKEDGLGATEIGKKMGLSESTVRSLLNADSEARMTKAQETANFIKKQIDSKGMIDVSTGVERELGVSKEKLEQALYLLERDGYHVVSGGIPQVTNKGQQTTQKVIGPPDMTYKINENGKKVSSEIYDFDKVHTLTEYVSHDDGETFDKFVFPKSMDSSRLMIRYKEDGGIDKDGTVELRRNVDDLSLGESRYSQVRILVDGNKYIKGMAVYSDDMPKGVDVVFNTNKTKDVAKMDVLKDIKADPDNPFGSLIKPGGQSYYVDVNGKKQLSLINKRADEGDWDEWKNGLPSQFLSKQSVSMAKKQLGLAITSKTAEYDEISALTNPTIKKHLLDKFADECDSAAVHLKAAALPGQKYHVIIPITSMKDDEVFAPKYENGTKLALIRYPHGGPFEIPILKVNNKQADAKKLLELDSIDAIGINSKVAERLSGADFDGDTVMTIPTHDSGGKVKITSTPPLKGLEGFEPKTVYGADEVKTDSSGTKHYYRNGKEYRIMKNTGTQMGVVSNLITDMSIFGANDNEKAAAVRHSMVVIDAEKHKLDYRQSEIDNNISALKKKYQRTVDENGDVHTGGASTILSRSKGQVSIPKRQGSPIVNIKGKPNYDPSKPEGSLIYKTADDVSYTVRKVNKKTGEVTTTVKNRTQRSTKMAETDDAMSLVSSAKSPMELAYATYANKMKSMANQARKESMSTGKIEYSKNAHASYAKEVSSLDKKLNEALLNAPRERQAQRLANADVKRKTTADPTMKSGDVKKASQQALTKYRNEVGSVSRRNRSIKITDKEWEAIQAGAISESHLKKILNNSDVDELRQRATPRSTTGLTSAQISRVKALRASNYTLSEIAKMMGKSASAISSYLKE